MRYWDRVRVTSWFYEGMEFTVIDYLRWEQANENYDYVEVPYDMKKPHWWIMPLLPEQKKYKLYDEKLERELKWPEDGWFLESNLEIIN